VPPAGADPTPSPVPPPGRPVADLDGLYLWLGPSGGATRVDGAWDSAWGGGVQVVRVRERARLGLIGAWLGGARYASRDGGRVWLEGLAGTRRVIGQMVGVGLGPTLELGDLHHPRAGLSASIWWFAGVVPYARAGVLDASGPFAEIGVSLSLPAVRH